MWSLRSGWRGSMGLELQSCLWWGSAGGKGIDYGVLGFGHGFLFFFSFSPFWLVG